MTTILTPDLPFLDKNAFRSAVDHFITHLKTYSKLSFELKSSPYDDSDAYLLIKKYICAPVRKDENSIENAKNVSASESKVKTDPIPDNYIAIEDEEDDPELLIATEVSPEAANADSVYTHVVHYHIPLSPIYSVPVLYFNIYPISDSSIPVHTISTVYDLLVPAPSRSHASSELLHTGLQGGISQSHHPYLQTPWWFIHPCNTADALRQWGDGLNLQNYLGVWIGMAGSVVGLNIRMGGNGFV